MQIGGSCPYGLPTYRDTGGGLYYDNPKEKQLYNNLITSICQDKNNACSAFLLLTRPLSFRPPALLYSSIFCAISFLLRFP